MPFTKRRLQRLAGLLKEDTSTDLTIEVKKVNSITYEFFAKLNSKKVGHMRIEQVYEDPWDRSVVGMKNLLGLKESDEIRDFNVQQVWTENEYRKQGLGLQLYKYVIEWVWEHFNARLLPGDYFARTNPEYNEYLGKWGTTKPALGVWNKLLHTGFIDDEFYPVGLV